MTSDLEDLTPAEMRMLGLLAEGLSNRAIADRSNVSLRTVESHIHRILFKLCLPPGDEIDRRVTAVLLYLGRFGHVGQRPHLYEIQAA